MLHGCQVSLVVPTLNEEEGLRRLLGLVPRSVDEVVVVDGGETDGTRRIAQEGGAKVIVERRRGYGRALKTGFAQCSGEIIATADGDATYPVASIERVVDRLVADGLDFVSCARLPLSEPESMSLRNLLGNRMMTGISSLLWRHRFHDILSGMWVFRRPVLERLELRSDCWNFSEEIKLRAFVELGQKFSEFHIAYHPRLGRTKLLPWRVGFENIRYLLAMRWGGSALQKSCIAERP